MKLEHYYKQPENIKLNFGVINRIIEWEDEDGETLVECSNIGTLSSFCCLDFTPAVGMEVELFIDTDKDENANVGWVLKKVSP